jgi:hypothetical protein
MLMRFCRAKFLATSASRSIHFALILSVGIFTLIFFSEPGLSAQSQRLPYDPDLGPSFYKVSLNYSYSKIYERIEDVDFRNLTMHVFDEHGKPEMKVELKKGKYENRDNVGYETVKLDSTYYLPSQDSNRMFALVLYTWFYGGGSSNTEGIAEVFELVENRLTLIQQLGWDEHFDTTKPYALFREKSGTLIVRTAHYLPGDPHCCVSADDVITLRWKREPLH